MINGGSGLTDPPRGPRRDRRTTIRPARFDDLAAVRSVEIAAGAVFAAIGMHAVAQDEPPSVQELQTYQRLGRAWVAVDALDVPVAYLLLDVVDGAAHIEQVSVHPDHARRGIGGDLIDVAERWAAASGMTALTLTTFAAVAWNAPYYRRLGFRDLGADELGKGLRAVRAREAAHGLNAWPRVAMTRLVNPLQDDG